MKKYLALLIAILMLILASGNNSTSISRAETSDDSVFSETPSWNEVTTSSEENNNINMMEKLTEIEDVISVTKPDFSNRIYGAVAYKVLFESNNGKLATNVVLPDD